MLLVNIRKLFKLYKYFSYKNLYFVFNYQATDFSGFMA